MSERCRSIWQILKGDCGSKVCNSVAVAEQFADGKATIKMLRAARAAASHEANPSSEDIDNDMVSVTTIPAASAVESACWLPGKDADACRNGGISRFQRSFRGRC